MTTSLTFQDASARLIAFWADQGCLVWQPHNVEVGAGTLNPATFLHVLGPEPWNVVYLEPSIRPADGRYGENPNRMSRFHQIQVILKPEPGDPQGLYLESLASLGVRLANHDVRFVEDNWESPAVGAWGLGWEVWLDGLEITQFTYFQQAGSFDLDPVSVEITYGLDRIMMALQDVRHFKDLRWSDRVTCAAIHLPSEVQTSRYYFEVAGVERLRAMYDLCEAEADAALAADLPLVAHDYVLKCSHVFNVLDARGAVGVTERARYFGRMRRMARAVAERHLESRRALGHPLLEADRPWIAGSASGAPSSHAPRGDGEGADATPPADCRPEAPADFLLEVATEELPVADQDLAVDLLTARVPSILCDLRLSHGPVTAMATPRRLAVLVESLAARQEDLEMEVIGPPRTAAFDPEGRPTRAAEGFAASAGVTVAELGLVERGGQERVAAVKRVAGLPAAEALSGALVEMLRGLSFPRSMRWNASGQAFSRPVRGLVALHGGHVVPLEFAGLVAGRVTHGLRRAGATGVRLASAAEYRPLMADLGVTVDRDARRIDITRQTAALAAEVGGVVPDDPELVAEVANLTEQPLAIRGEFEPRYLELPAEVLVTVLRKHQRIFPVADGTGALLPFFVAVANGRDVDVATVRHGNEAVVRARFADAAWFWQRDTARPLSEFTPSLANLTFQADLGSVLDKVHRLEALVPWLSERLGLGADDAAAAKRAAALAKSDLATEMVVDFTSLQGSMGRAYARRSGESEAVAEAIFEQYLPRGAGDLLPATPAGIVLALADRVDSLVGLFAAGLKPKGTADPYGLRRAAVGLATILVDTGLSLDLAAAVDAAASAQPIEVTAEARADLLAFLQRRLEGQLREAGHAADAVAAVLAVTGGDPAVAARLATTIEKHVASTGWQDTLHAYARCLRIVRPVKEALPAVDPALFAEPAEARLHEAVSELVAHLDRRDLDAVLSGLEHLAPTVNRFFDECLVMADDPALRANRLALVRSVAELPAGLVDLSLVEGF